MALGESTFQDVIFIAKNPAEPKVSLNLPPVENQDCCVEPIVFASLSNTDPFENDKTSVIWIYDNGITNVEMKLQQWVGSSFIDVATLNNNTLGTAYLFGQIQSVEGDNLVGYLIDWNKVLLALGLGTYRIQTTETTVFGSTVNQESDSWCLQEYNPNLVKGSVKIEWENSHIICGLNSGTQTFDFGTTKLAGEIRLQDSIFGFDSSTYERDFVKYQNKQKVWLKDIEEENYILKTGRLTEDLHDYIKNFILKGDNIKVTDYNQNNSRTHIQTKVIFSGDYAPEYVSGSKLSKVELNFTNEFTIERKRC